jgi:integrase/recombinase XerD
MNADHTASTIVTTTTPAELIAAGFLARYPAKTRDGYRIHLRHWFEFCHLHRVDPMNAQRMHIEAFARHLTEDLERMPQTVAGKLNAVCGLYRFAYLDGLIPVDPAAHVRRPKIPFQSSTEGLTRPEFADILAAAEVDGIATHALVCLIGLNGLRIGECLSSNIEHLGNERGYRTIHLPHRKGGKVGTLSLAVRTAWAIERAIADRDTGPILLGRDGQRMSAGSARRTVQRLAKKCKVRKRITPHSFRHTFVTMALDAGVAERDIVDSTGHQDSRMLRYYDRNRGAIERNATHAVAAFVGAAA